MYRQMSFLRALFLRNNTAAIVLVMAALCIKMLVPAGFMIDQNSKVITVQICDDASGHVLTKLLAIPMKGEPSNSTGKQGKMDCPFSTLSMASAAGADQALLAVALAFILALGFAQVRGALPKPVFYLRPPLRGPPASI